MCNDNDGLLVFDVDFFQKLEDLDAGLEVQGTRWLVAQQEVRIFTDSPGDSHALLLAAAHLSREVVRPVGEAHVFHNFIYTEMVSDDFRGQLHIFPGGQVAQQVVELEDEAHDVAAVLGQRLLRKVAEDFPTVVDGAGSGLVHAAQNVEHGGLAGAAGAQDDDEFAFFNVEGHATEGFDGDFAHEVMLRQLADVEDLVLFHGACLLVVVEGGVGRGCQTPSSVLTWKKVSDTAFRSRPQSHLSIIVIYTETAPSQTLRVAVGVGMLAGDHR